jgi:hypothetical protein
MRRNADVLARIRKFLLAAIGWADEPAEDPGHITESDMDDVLVFLAKVHVDSAMAEDRVAFYYPSEYGSLATRRVKSIAQRLSYVEITSHFNMTNEEFYVRITDDGRARLVGSRTMLQSNLSPRATIPGAITHGA